jgi:methionine-rich copper-binding protein CopC
MSRKLALSIAVSLSLALAANASSASAHALLKTATPAVGGTVSASPSEIRITFSEGVEPHFSGIALTNKAGAAMPVGKSSTVPSDNSTLMTPVLQALEPGLYTVKWHAVAIDTHKTQGSFQFTVQP